jgi:cytochrome c peroxidase
MKYFKTRTARLFCAVMAVILLTLSLPVVSSAQPLLDPNAVRDAAMTMGLNALSTRVITLPPELMTYVRTKAVSAADLLVATDPPTTLPPTSIPNPYDALLILGKALFWDQQVGSDGQACASCHYNAGTDVRTINSLNPGLRNTNAAEATTWNPTASGTAGGPNYQLVPSDYPFHQLTDPLQTSYRDREVIFDTDDVTSSQGVLARNFTSVTPGALNDVGTVIPGGDPTFTVAGTQYRRVSSRNPQSTLNTIFNFSSFFDGRASNVFNGVDPFGPIDATALLYINGGSVLTPTPFMVTESSLASQAVGPPLDTGEMSYIGRTWPDIGRKLLNLSPTAGAATQPLHFQQVAATDSVLGVVDSGAGNGINVNYRQLIQWAFLPQYWDSTGPIIAPATTPSSLRTATGFHLMEANFSFFFGLAVQAYEQLLITGQTRYDKFMEGDNSALTQDEMKGLLTYINTESANINYNPIFNGIEFGACQLCHSGIELTENTNFNVPAKGFITTDVTLTMDHNRGLVIVPSTQCFDVGFSNIGVRPNREDLGRGGDALGKPLSFWRALLVGLTYNPVPGVVPVTPPAPNPNRVGNTDGSFKIPLLRNIELTGPYFHNGGTLTLAQAVAFYARGGDFVDVNIEDMDIGIAMNNLSPEGIDLIVKFLLSLTDERVRLESAPFDRPQLYLPSPNTALVANATNITGGFSTNLPAVGAAGWPTAAQSPVHSFMNISNTPIPGPNNDQFDY